MKPDPSNRSLYLNIDPNDNAALIGVGPGTDAGWSSLIRGNDCCDSGGVHLFDVIVNFDSTALGAGASFNFEFTAAGLTANDFNWTSVGAPPALPVLAVINNINASHCSSAPDCGTGQITVGLQVPEPSTLAIFGLGLAGLGFMRRRRRVV